MKFQHFFKVHQISSNLQNIFESSSETCMWNLKRSFISQKNANSAPLEISWNFNIFSKFTKFHQTCRTYLNHHQKHACEILAHSEKLTYLKKNANSAALEISWNFNIFSKFTKFSNLQNIFESSSETCMWNFPFREINLFKRKMQCRALKYHEISTFFQSSPNFIKLAEHIWIIIRNMHVKFEPIQRSWLIS